MMLLSEMMATTSLANRSIKRHKFNDFDDQDLNLLNLEMRCNGALHHFGRCMRESSARAA